ncbi:MAG TPA: phenylalanine--tRNA ligase subunit beta, partial [Acidobacteriota bacterium]|nr:phenylalanine--tRNA ligase subunit beta [Acidobacteriota bacterium]
MKISYNWLREVSGVEDDAATVISKLTMVGIKLEGQEAVGDDLMIDFEVTVNRPDCLSVYGIARELCAIYGAPAPAPPEIHGSNVIEARSSQGDYPAGEKTLRIVLEDPELCPRYCGQVLTNVKVGPAPEWMRNRIEACGVRSINNVVDVTNYVMLELGQPMHAFDYDKLARGTIRVRRGRNEKLVTLDGKERVMSDAMLVIADDEVPVGIGGVMGGKDSEVSDSTTTVLLESAYFQPNSVRKTRRDLDLSTDASFRFERGADPAMQATAERRAALLLEQVAGARVHPVLDVSARRFETSSVELRYERIQRVLGTKIDPVKVDHILTALGFIKDGPRSWRVPSFRVDIKRE